MRTIKGPAIYLAQVADEREPLNNFDGLTKWAKRKGFDGVQLQTWDPKIFDLEKAASSQDYCDELKGVAKENGVEITELGSHLQGQLVAVHPAFDVATDGFAPAHLKGKYAPRQEWAVEQLKMIAKASSRLGLDRHVTFSGGLLWPYSVPFPKWSAGLIDEGFDELARRWKPILDTYEDNGVDLCFELFQGEDLHDGLTYEMFLERVDNHPRCMLMYDPSHLLLQSIDYLAFIDHYHERIRMFHVKDAEFRPDGKTGAFGGFQPWINRAGRYRSPGDGQIDFKTIFSKLSAYDFDGWAVLEWECCLKNFEQGTAEGARFIRDHIIEVPATSDRQFDDFVKSESGGNTNRMILGLT